jgi:hypothetical protein
VLLLLLPSRATGLGQWPSLAQPIWAELGPAQKSKNKIIKKSKNKIKCICMNKNNKNLLVYSLTLESGIKILV